jgi:Ras-related protein Rab-8A
MERFDHMVKILLIGESGVGKTCVLHKFNNGEFQVNHLTTIAIDFKVKYFDVKNTRLKM